MMDMPITDALRHVLEALDHPLDDVERQLYRVGDDLGRASELLGNLTSIFEALPEALEHPDLRRAVDDISEVVREIALVADTLTGERAVLVQLVALSNEVSSRIDRLSRTVEVISIIAVNARIAASKLDGRGEDFAVFTQEIARLARSTVDTIKAFADENGRLVAFLKKACASQAQFDTTHKETLTSVRQRLEKSLASLAQKRRQTIDAAKIVGAQSGHIREGVSSAVMALQIGDITRQRLEHVSQAVRTMLDGTDMDGLPPDERDALTGMIIRLQSAQTGRASGDFDIEVDRIIRSLAGLAGDAESVLRIGIDLYGAQSRSGRSFLSVLGAELTKAEQLIKVCSAARAEVDLIAAEAGRTLILLLERIRAVHEIEIDMRLIGLNTMFRCGRLGSAGYVLSVIAQELRVYANQTVEDAKAVTEALNAVSATADMLNRDRSHEVDTPFSALEEKTRSSAALFTAVGGELSQALDVLERDGKEVAQLLRKTIAGIDFRDAINLEMTSIIEELDQIGRAAPSDTHGLDDVKRTILSRLERNYTMSSERDIHRTLSDPSLEKELISTASLSDIDAVRNDIFF